MYVYEIALLEELMDGISDQRANSEYCLEGVGTVSQMRNGTKVFHSVTLILNRIVRAGLALYGNLSCLNLERLLSLRGKGEDTLYDHCCTDVGVSNLIKVSHDVMIDNLNLLKEGSIGQDQEPEILGITVISYPTSNVDFFACISVSFPKQGPNFCKFHDRFSSHSYFF